ncbi:MAG: UDP-N-acetylmuramoyl-tripeptide--D-alanyl-D-alanine ligase [Desulfuromonadales bacterium]|nr:UDP-N-acetylmuramoyl-tripeptide--D-alanyl-D-alanine ligase [Desulfuromonadales bacterium]
MFRLDEILKAVNGKVTGTCSEGVTGVSTDSRSIKPGELFIPLRGEKFDGHRFINDVVSKGVKLFIADSDWVKENEVPSDSACVEVKDTLRALGDLAHFHRMRFSIPVIGITGSNGKTTTKEMLASILEIAEPGLKTEGNLNNLVGLPLMLFKLTNEHKWAVLEMGMSEFGEIDRLAEIAAPQIGVITNAYPAHLQGVGSIAGVAKAKGELFLRLPAEGTAIFNHDDPLIAACPVAEGVKKIGFGLHDSDVTGSYPVLEGAKGESFHLTIGEESSSVMLKAFGVHNVSNALAAAAAAYVKKVPFEQIVKGLENFRPYGKRFNLEDLGPVVLIDDSYNANPASVGAALLTFQQLKGGHRAIAVLGDMLELGDERDRAHSDAGKLAATCVDRLYLYGEMAQVVAEGAKSSGLSSAEIIIASDREEIVADIIKDHIDGDFILVKGSRGMEMDKVAEMLRSNFSDSSYTRRAY